MSIIVLIVTAIALSMDAFAVAISCGITNSAKKTTDKLKIAFAFGLFQGLMPIAGYFLSGILRNSIERYTGIIAFIILIIIGINMIRESFKIKNDCNIIQLTLKRILILAIATSIDAFAMGITFSMIEIDIFSSATLIFSITFLVSYIGVVFGCKINNLFRKSAEIIGGCIIILIGIKILIENI